MVPKSAEWAVSTVACPEATAEVVVAMLVAVWGLVVELAFFEEVDELQAERAIAVIRPTASSFELVTRPGTR